ncbi:DnaA ATPase domain-containing protein [Liberibacter crescens]|nr:DnaA/Hda family protein [Liberibacter crescens]
MKNERIASLKEDIYQRRDYKQLPLAFPPCINDISREEILISKSLEAAVHLIDTWPVWPSSVVILVGPRGSGKSYIANVWCKISKAHKIHATKGSNSAFIVTQGPALLEDADHVNFDETELFHIINSVYQKSSSLLITSRTFPSSWTVHLPDLYSRLQAATVVKIGLPDEDFLIRVIVKMFADRQLFVEERVIAYIVQRMERSLASAENLVDSLDKMALARGVAITRSLAAEVLMKLENVNCD